MILKNDTNADPELIPGNSITSKKIVIGFINDYIDQIKLLQADFQIVFYYENNTSCSFCIEKLVFAQQVYEQYKNNNSVIFLIRNSTEKPSFYNNQSQIYGRVFLHMTFGENEKYVENESITDYESLIKEINDFIEKYSPVKLDEEEGNIIDLNLLGWHIKIDPDDFSLPLLTVVLGGLDSLNPCAFFILIFLLNLLIYARSRKRMLLIGLVFIFFSGLLYMLFMFLMYETLLNIQTQGNIAVISIIIGCIVLPMGILNIKDFFFFKKGASLSIPEDKKPKIFKQMRDLVKNPRLGAVLLGTIILAATVNFYELLCTLGLPFVFSQELARRSVTEGSGSYFGYILLYNIVYVLPLIIIVLFFVLTLGKRKLTEWHGRLMKLLSGIMLSCFGIIFLINYQILENILTPILLLILSIISTLVISFIWKKFNLVKQG